MVSRSLRIVRQRLRSVWRKNELDRRLDQELAFHLDQLVRENIAEGMPAEEARLAAQRTLGNIPLLGEQCRDQRRVTWVHDFRQDLRYALRQLDRDRGVTAVLVLTIALGIGVNTGIFGILNGFLRPLPVRAPEQIVVVAADTKDDASGFQFRFSYAALEDFRRRADCFRDLFGFNSEIGGFSTGGKSTQILYSAVTGNYFSALGVTPALGRLFVPGEGENAGADLTMVLGYAFWQSRLGGDPNVIGKQIRLSGRTATVVGVAAKGFHGTFSNADMQGYLPLRSFRHGRPPEFERDLHQPLAEIFDRARPLEAGSQPGAGEDVHESAGSSSGGRVSGNRQRDRDPRDSRTIGPAATSALGVRLAASHRVVSPAPNFAGAAGGLHECSQHSAGAVHSAPA
jgi:hypothetical protein